MQEAPPPLLSLYQLPSSSRIFSFGDKDDLHLQKWIGRFSGGLGHISFSSPVLRASEHVHLLLFLSRSVVRNPPRCMSSVSERRCVRGLTQNPWCLLKLSSPGLAPDQEPEPLGMRSYQAQLEQAPREALGIDAREALPSTFLAFRCFLLSIPATL